MTLPDEPTIIALHQKYAPSQDALRIVYGHCQIIHEIARQLIDQNALAVDEQFVRVAALLHDIGYYPLFDETGRVPKELTITHGVAGARILRQEGIEEAIWRVAERHTGVGLSQQAIIRQNLPLPKRDFVPETPEGWLILYADKLHTKSVGPNEPRDVLGWFNSPETYLKTARKHGPENADKFIRLVERYGTPDLLGLATKYEQELR